MSYMIFTDQKAFMDYFGQKAGPEAVALYRNLILGKDEEVDELKAALAKYDIDPSVENITEIADACIDILYVTIGLLHALGLVPQALWDEVQRSNIDKLKHPCVQCSGTGRVQSEETGEIVACKACDGQGHTYEVRRRESDGKVLKPDGWRAPALLPLVEQMLAKRAA